MFADVVEREFVVPVKPCPRSRTTTSVVQSANARLDRRGHRDELAAAPGPEACVDRAIGLWLAANGAGGLMSGRRWLVPARIYLAGPCCNIAVGSPPTALQSCPWVHGRGC